MKKTVSLFLLIWLWLGSITPAQAQEPAVIRAGWKAGPGEALGIYGAGFSQPGEQTQVFLYPLGDGKTPARHTAWELRILNMDDGVIQGEIPADMPKDQYFGIVKVGTQNSEPFLMNTPQADWLSDPEICAGQTVRLFGRNFLHPADAAGNQTAVWLCDLETNAELPAEVTAVTAYTVDFLVPKTAVPDRQYTVRIQAGPSSYGSARLPEDEAVVCRADTNFQAVKDQYGIELGWACELNLENCWNVRDFGAAGDGRTDDSTAVQAALAAAEKAGGGRIYFPAGIYDITSLEKGLSIPAHTVLAGDGRENTVIRTNLRINGAAGASGICGLTVRSDAIRPGDDTRRLISGYVGGLVYASNPQARFFMQDAGIYAADGSSFVSYEHRQIVIENCHFDITHQGPMLTNDNSYIRMNLRFRNNYVRNTQRSMLWCGNHSWIDGCTFDGDNGGDNCEKGENGQAATMEHRISEMWGDKIYYGNNLVTGTIGDQRPGHDDNSGEGVCNQATCIIALDKTKAADTLTITGNTDFDAVQAGEDPVAGNRGKKLIGAKIAVISGRGLGQVRRVVAAEGDTLTIDSPWTVIPAPGDVFTVDGSIAERYIIVNNRIEAKTRKGGIMLYNKSYDNIIADNVLTNSGGIWFGKAQEPSQKRSGIAYFNYVAGNQLSGGIMDKEGGMRDNALCIGPGDDGGTEMNSNAEINAVSQFGNLYRGNTIHGNGTQIQPESDYNGKFVLYNGFVVSTPDSGTGTAPLARGLILDGNRAYNSVNGVTLSNTASRTLLYKNDFSGNGTDYQDYFSQGTVVVKADGQAEAWPGPAYDWTETVETTQDTAGRVFQSVPVQIGDRRYLYIAGQGGLYVYCVTDGIQLVQSVQEDTSEYYSSYVAARDGMLYYAVNRKNTKKLYGYAINPDGTVISQAPAWELRMTITGLAVCGDVLVVCQASNGASVYDIHTREKVASFAAGTAVRSIQLERLDADTYRVYYITQTPYTENIGGTDYTCGETFHIAELKNHMVTTLFSGKPQGGPWPGFGEYAAITGLGAGWGSITVLEPNIIQLNPDSKNFNYTNLVIDARDPQSPVITGSYTNNAAVRGMVKLRPRVFAALLANGDIYIWDYADPSSRIECAPVKHGQIRSGKDISILGNQLYVMSDSGFAVYGLETARGIAASMPYMEYAFDSCGDGGYTLYWDIYAGEGGALTITAAEYASGNRLTAADARQISVQAGHSRIQQKFVADNNEDIKIMVWNDMIPLQEAKIFYSQP